MNTLKTIAMYLPQFHNITENNEWWGEGYTEWTAARKAERLFDGHYQPREPLNDNYYNLLDKSTMLQQAEMAKQYHLDGFCFYHYYFKEGRKILEKPAENLLSWKDVDMPFCFCWANESWGRTWGKKKNMGMFINSWADIFEKEAKNDNNSNGILLEQRYGREREWQKHLEYLLPFFRDERYIKKESAPVLLICKPDDIVCLGDMIRYWKKKVREYNIDDIYVIGLNTVKKANGLDAVLLNGPSMYCMTGTRERNIERHWKNGIENYKYEEVWRNAIEAEPVPECKTYFGAFTDYDDTPRRGKNGWFLDETSLEIFQKYLYLLMKKNKMAGNEYVFINAFNEWGEGMYLEPDKKNGYGYLESLRDAKEKINFEQEPKEYYSSENRINDESKTVNNLEKGWSYVYLLDKWLTIHEEKKRLSDYLKRHHYNKIAIYGIGILGRHLLFELHNEGITIEYIIDRTEAVSDLGIKVCKLSTDIDIVDAIIVTATYEFDKIWKDIRKHNIDCPVLSLVEMLNEI